MSLNPGPGFRKLKVDTGGIKYIRADGRSRVDLSWGVS